MKTPRMMTLLLACALGLPLAAQAGTGRPPAPRPRPRALLHRRRLRPQMGALSLARLARNPAVRKRLNLTGAQVQQIESASLAWQKERINDRARRQLARLQLAHLRQAAQPGGMPDEAAIDRQLAAVSSVALAMAKAATHYRLAMRSALTPAQRQQLAAMRRPPRLRGRGRNRMPPPPSGAGSNGH